MGAPSRRPTRGNPAPYGSVYRGLERFQADWNRTHLSFLYADPTQFRRPTAGRNRQAIVRRGGASVSGLVTCSPAATVCAGKSALCTENSEIPEIAGKPLLVQQRCAGSLPPSVRNRRTGATLDGAGNRYFSAISDASESSVHNAVPAAHDDPASPGTDIRALLFLRLAGTPSSGPRQALRGTLATEQSKPYPPRTSGAHRRNAPRKDRCRSRLPLKLQRPREPVWRQTAGAAAFRQPGP